MAVTFETVSDKCCSCG